VRIKLAGYNVDYDILKRLTRSTPVDLTPETLSAAYARISRSPLPIDQLRKKARTDVERARKSNQKIIFDMGHHSVAEHAVFNFDIMGVSRLALEEIEGLRLVSYMEKSQRYVTLEGDYVLPAEIRDPDMKRLFREIVQRQNRFYERACAAIASQLSKTSSQGLEDKQAQKMLEIMAKEDARYILPLATQGQAGMTINARNLEHLFRRCRLSRREEVHRVAEKLHALVMPIAPSIILFPEPSAFERTARRSLQSWLPEAPAMAEAAEGPQIVSCTANGDELILASFLSSQANLSLPDARARVQRTSQAKKKELFREFFSTMQFYDAPPREFEMVDIAFQARVSAANFAQLKRHRLATLLAGDYNPKLGNTVPDNVRAAGMDQEFLDIIGQTNDAHARIRALHGPAADYILTNSHRRCVLMKMNLREMYHFVRLRDDEHAQWDIRHLAHQLAEQIRAIMPLSAMLLCGKCEFDRQLETHCRPAPERTIKAGMPYPEDADQER
jgi:flavin-dependent thymidylate synthase